MTEQEAAQISALLNERNQLVVRYDAARVLADEAQYVYRTNAVGAVVACLEVKKVQWYQFEVCHVTVAREYEGRGVAKGLVEEAERSAIANGARILQCTIREDNSRSQGLFRRCGFIEVSKFFYPISGHHVTVWQKVVSRKG